MKASDELHRILMPAQGKAGHSLLVSLDASLREIEAAGADLSRALLTSIDRGFVAQSLLYEGWKSGDPLRRKGIASEPAAPGYSGHHRFIYDEEAKAWVCAAVDIDTDTRIDSHDDPKQKLLADAAERHGLVAGIHWGDPVHYGLKLDKWAMARDLFASLDRVRG